MDEPAYRRSLGDAPWCCRCAAKLPPGIGKPTVRCGKCGAEQDHPEPLALGTEVMVLSAIARSLGKDPDPFFVSYELGVVTGCKQPGTVEVRVGESTNTEDLSDITAVTSVGIQSNMRVYLRHSMGWKLTWAERATEKDIVVKHPSHDAFQDDFFNDVTALDNVRIPLDESCRERRTKFQQYWAERRDSPGGVVFLFVFVLIAIGMMWSAF